MKKTARKTKEYLTARQAKVVALVAEGHSEKEIASALGVSDKTVNGLRERAKAKLKKNLGLPINAGTAELTHYAIARGLVKLRFTL